MKHGIAAWVSLAAISLSACTIDASDRPRLAASAPDSCATAPMIGRFDPRRDLLVANFDSKPDVDDLHSVAALATVVRDPAFACVDYIATHGAYGTQTGDLLPAASLYDLAFPQGWLDADADRDGAVATIAEAMRSTIDAGGKVWVAEAGQSDVTAAAVEHLPRALWRSVNVVQHSYWNESKTSAGAMQKMVYSTSYHRVQDGNFADNGSPAFSTRDGSHWAALLADPQVGPIWQEAKHISDIHNPLADYVNPAVEAGGLDFSDHVEIAYIFGFADMEGVGDYVTRFVATDD